MRPNNTVNDLMNLHRPSSSYPHSFDLHTGRSRSFCQFRIVDKLTQVCSFKNKYAKNVLCELHKQPVHVLSFVPTEA